MGPKRRKGASASDKGKQPAQATPATNANPKKRSKDQLLPEQVLFQKAQNRLRAQKKLIRDKVKQSTEWLAADEETREELEELHLRQRLRRWKEQVKDARAAVDEALGREMKSNTVNDELRLANNAFRQQKSKALKLLKAQAAYKNATPDQQTKMEEAQVNKECARQKKRFINAQKAVKDFDEEEGDEEDDSAGSGDDSSAAVGNKRTRGGGKKPATADDAYDGMALEEIARLPPPALPQLNLDWNSDDDDGEEPDLPSDYDETVFAQTMDEDAEWTAVDKLLLKGETIDSKSLPRQAWTEDALEDLEDGFDDVTVKVVKGSGDEVIAGNDEKLPPPERLMNRWVPLMKFANRPEVIGLYEIPDEEFHRKQERVRKRRDEAMAKRMREKILKDAKDAKDATG